VEVRVRNHLTRDGEAQIEIHVPEGWKISPEWQTVNIVAKQTSRAEFVISIPDDDDPGGTTILTSNVVFAGRDWGEIGEMVVDHGYNRPPSILPWDQK